MMIARVARRLSQHRERFFIMLSEQKLSALESLISCLGVLIAILDSGAFES